MKFNGLENSTKKIENTEEFKKNISSFEDLTPKEYFKNFFLIHLKDKTFIANLNYKDLRIVDSKNHKEILETYGYLTNIFYENPFDKEITDQLLAIENKLSEMGHPVSQADFKFIKDFSEEDLKLLNDVVGPYNFDLDIELNKLNLDELLLYIRSLKNSDKKDFKRLLSHLDRFFLKNEDSFKPFISLSGGDPKILDTILILSEKLPKEVAGKVFHKYGEIIDSTEDINQILNERFGKQEENQEIILKIKENLLKKGKDLLINSAKNLDKCTDAECEELGKNIEEKLDFISKENILLGSTFKELLKKENLQINEIRDVSVNMINTPEGIIKFKDELVRIFKENREDYPEELLKETLAEFEEALNNIEDKEFYILKNKEDILAFMRFDIIENGNYYAGSLNGRNEIQGLAVGGSFLKQLLIDKSKGRSIEAVVYEKNQMLNRYANEFGFKIVGEIENYHNTGQKFYKLEIKKGSLS